MGCISMVFRRIPDGIPVDGCSQIPKSPILQEGAVGVNVPVNSLPPCPGDPTNDSSGLSGGAIAGIVIGCVAAGVGEPRMQAQGRCERRQSMPGLYQCGELLWMACCRSVHVLLPSVLALSTSGHPSHTPAPTRSDPCGRSMAAAPPPAAGRHDGRRRQQAGQRADVTRFSN